MSRPLQLSIAALILVAAACGSDDSATDTAADADADSTTTAAADEAMDDEAMTDESMEDEAMTDESMDDEAMTDESMEDEAMTDESMDDEAMEDEAMTEDAMAEPASDLTIVSIDFDTSEVLIANHTGADIDIEGYWMCNFPNYAQLEGVGAVPAGGTLTVESPVGIAADDGELGLYTAETFSDAGAIAAYVEWGDGEHERSPVAVEAGIHDGSPATVDGSMLTAG